MSKLKLKKQDCVASSLSPVKFRQEREFRDAVTARVNAYFSASGRGRRDAAAFYVKAALLLSWLIASYLLLVFLQTETWQALLLAISLALAVTATAFNIFHDAGHDAISRSRIVNRLAFLLMNLVGASSYVWRQRHNVIHHTFANLHEYDCDIDIGKLGRLSPHQPFLPMHRFQHFYLWVLYGFYSIKWQFIDDIKPFITGRLGFFEFNRPGGFDLFAFVAGKVGFLCMAFVLPLTRHSLVSVLALYFLVYFINGTLFVIVVQLSHLVEQTETPAASFDRDVRALDVAWANHQAQASCNFSQKNALLSWFLGGLNFQVEHHQFPRICHVHYPMIAPIVATACKEFGIAYNLHPSIAAGLRSHFRHLRSLANPPDAQPGVLAPVSDAHLC
jgi:linoleoyl-CoA desaturase